jgi:hypothetical protein
LSVLNLIEILIFFNMGMFLDNLENHSLCLRCLLITGKSYKGAA